MNHIRAGVVGVGYMGRYHTEVYSELFNVDLAGVCDVDEERAKSLARNYETKAFIDYRDMFGKVDVVSIAVPTEMHFEVTMDFLNSGVHVLLEKPVSRKLSEAEELFKIAEKNDVVLMIGHVERFNGAVQELKKIVNNPIFIESRRLGPFIERARNDGVVMDLMIHDLDIILNLVESDVKSIHAMGTSVFSDHEDLANVQICFKNGCLANITASRATQHKIRTMAISQQDAYIFLDFADQDIHIHRQASSEHRLTRGELRYKQEALIEQIYVHKDNPLKLEVKHLIDCAFNGGTRSVSVEKELASLRLALKVLDIFGKDKSSCPKLIS